MDNTLGQHQCSQAGLSPSTIQVTVMARRKCGTDLYRKMISFRKAFPLIRNIRGARLRPSRSVSTLYHHEPIMYTVASETGNMKITSTSVMSYHYTIYHYTVFHLNRTIFTRRSA